MKALIIQNSRGGYTIYPPMAQTGIGNFATIADAARVALLNGWEVAQ